MTTSEKLLAAAEDIWEGYHHHPFVRGIADGSLDQEKFRYYMIQDYLYLFDYARVFALGVAKAKDPETMKLFAGYVDQILDGEMDIHRGYMTRLGISEEEVKAMPLSLDNRSYTSYMLRVAYEEGAAEIAVAILSCAVSYEYIGARIVREHPEAVSHPFYGEWVQGYSDPGYAAHNRILENLVNQLTEGYSEAQLDHLTEIFIACSRYEAAFWQMAWERRL